jgi:hypothetical protein
VTAPGVTSRAGEDTRAYILKTPNFASGIGAL